VAASVTTAANINVPSQIESSHPSGRQYSEAILTDVRKMG